MSWVSTDPSCTQIGQFLFIFFLALRWGANPCTLIIWILPSGALFYDQNVQNASCRLTFGVFAFPVTIHNGDKKKALEYIKRK